VSGIGDSTGSEPGRVGSKGGGWEREVGELRWEGKREKREVTMEVEKIEGNLASVVQMHGIQALAADELVFPPPSTSNL